MSTRLPGARYKAVFGRGRSVKGRLAASWRLDSPGAAPAAGVVVSRKTFARATDRNRAKRILREAFRLLAKEGAAPAGAEWVFVARRAIAGRKCRDVAEELKWIFSRDSRRKP